MLTKEQEEKIIGIAATTWAELARENAVEIFKFYINGCTTNHLMNHLGTVSKMLQD